MLEAALAPLRNKTDLSGEKRVTVSLIKPLLQHVYKELSSTEEDTALNALSEEILVAQTNKYFDASAERRGRRFCSSLYNFKGQESISTVGYCYRYIFKSFRALSSSDKSFAKHDVILLFFLKEAPNLKSERQHHHPQDSLEKQHVSFSQKLYL